MGHRFKSIQDMITFVLTKVNLTQSSLTQSKEDSELKLKVVMSSSLCVTDHRTQTNDPFLGLNPISWPR